MNAARLPSPGPSFVREERLRLRGGDPSAGSDGSDEPGRSDEIGGSEVRLGLSAPSIMDDGWWLAHLWAKDEAGVVSARAVAPLAGPPPGAPLQSIGPALAGALSGLLAEEDGRALIRLRMPEADDESRPWERPLVVAVAVRWDPVRATAMRPNELARELLRAFRLALESAGSPA